MNNAVFTWVLRIGVMLVLAMGLWHLALRVKLIGDARVDLGGAEINVVYGVQKMLLGRPLYEDPEQAPFDVMQYTPAYYGLCAGIGKLLGMDPHDTTGLFLLSRIVSLLLNLFTVWMVFRWCRTLGAEHLPSIAVAALVFTLFTEHFYSRVDSLYALLLVASVTTYQRWQPQKGQARLLLLGALLSALCLLTKQTGMLVIGIFGTHLIILRQWRALFAYSSAVLLCIAVGMAMVLTSTTLDIFWKNTIASLGNGISSTMYKELLPLPVYKYYMLFHLAAAILIVRSFGRGDAPDRFLAVAMLLSYAFGLLTGMKHGSNLNYLFEAHFFTLVASAKWISSATDRIGHGLAVLFVVFGVFFGLHRTRLLLIRVGTDESQLQAERARQADLRVRDVLVGELGARATDRVFITYRGHLELWLNGQGLLAQKDVIEWSVHPLYDYSNFQQAMTDGTVRYVITDRPLQEVDILGTGHPLQEPVRVVEGRYIHRLPER